MIDAESAPSVDIVIAARNEEQSLGDCLSALLRQEYPKVRLALYVVLDDGTTDNSEYIARTNRATVLHCDRRGVSNSRNFGIKAGGGELIGFLDAHSVPGPYWLKTMVKPFADEKIGACQGSFSFICDDPAVQRLSNCSPLADEKRLSQHTIESRFSPFPWLVTGNSMFRRSAVEEAGLFRQSCRCEDTDLSWRVFLEGYQFVFARQARVVHYDHAAVLTHLKKHFYYGVGAAQLAQMYGFTGTRSAKQRVHSPSVELALIDLFYNLGKKMQPIIDKNEHSKHQYKPIREQFRPKFCWSPGVSLQVSPYTVYWTTAENETIAVHLLKRSRIVFDAEANLIFQKIAAASDRAATIASIASSYDVDQELVAPDVDEFVETLIGEELLIRCESTNSPHLSESLASSAPL